MAELQGNQLLDQIQAEHPLLGQFLRNYVLPSINNVGKQLGVSPVGAQAAPNAPSGISVKVAGEYMHVAINDNNEIQKGIQYFTEVSTSPSFSQPIVIDHGSSRTSHPFPLPTLDDNGNPVNYYVRSYAQYHGSHPSEAVVHGGKQPIAVTMGGTTQMTLLPSTGSGTASGNGQSGGSGLGKVLLRPQPQPKRSVGK
jgi:hypothetical protein